MIIMQSLENMFYTIWSFVPTFLLALLVLVAGIIIAKILRKAVLKSLELIKFSEISEKAGVEQFLRNGGVNLTAGSLVAMIFYWFVILATVLLSLDILGLEEAHEFFQRIVLYMPNIFVAAMILIFGSLLSKVARAMILTYLNNVGVQGSNAVASLAQYAILTFVMFVAAEQLSIGGQLLVSAFQIAFGGIALAFALAFGLGAKDVAQKISEKIYNSFTSKH